MQGGKADWERKLQNRATTWEVGCGSFTISLPGWLIRHVLWAEVKFCHISAQRIAQCWTTHTGKWGASSSSEQNEQAVCVICDFIISLERGNQASLKTQHTTIDLRHTHWRWTISSSLKEFLLLLDTQILLRKSLLHPDNSHSTGWNTLVRQETSFHTKGSVLFGPPELYP